MEIQNFCLVILLFMHIPALSLFVESTQSSNSDIATQSQPPYSCDSSDPSTKLYDFCKTTLPISERVKDLVSRLTLDEKITQLVDTAPGIPRLGIPAYEWWSEGLHGVGFLPRVQQGIHFFNKTIQHATSFPQVILTAASFDAHIWYRIGQASGKEARALYNAGQAAGMTFWAPNVNIFRDPRWGRGQETPGEDPLVTGTYGASFVKGFQGDSFEGGSLQEQLQASACCKHYTAHDLDNWKDTTRFIFDAQVTLQDLADTYQPPFQACVQKGKASSIMCAYNKVNGVPNCANYNFLTKTLREQWGFNGYITSDCDAVNVLHVEQGFAKTPEDAVADVLKAGMDIECSTSARSKDFPVSYLKNYTKSAIEKKKLPETEIDRALHNLFSMRMRLGLFNGDPKKQQYGYIGPDQVCSQEHQALSLEAALDGIVLLKNSHRLLPLSKSKIRSLAVIGPSAQNSTLLLGNYFGPACKNVTVLEGLQNIFNNTNYEQGCSTVECSSASIEKAVEIAKNGDQVILVMGLDQDQEKEKLDRVDLVLPGKQQELITAVAKAARNPVVLVLLSGGPVDITFAKHDKKIGSILWAGYPGEAGATALAQIIFGYHNPGGRLPMTWYPQDFIKIPMTDMRMRPETSSNYPGRTYRFYKGEKVFEFGDGLSYSKYTHKFASDTEKKLYIRDSNSNNQNKSSTARYKLVSDIGEQQCESMKFTVSVKVQNHGEMAGKHVVLLFARHKKHGSRWPIKKLVGFQTVKLNAGEEAEVKYELSPCEHLSDTNEQGQMVMEEGSQILVVGKEKYHITIII